MCDVKDKVGGNVLRPSSDICVRIKSVPGRGKTGLEALRPEESWLIWKTERRSSWLRQFRGDGSVPDEARSLVCQPSRTLNSQAELASARQRQEKHFRQREHHKQNLRTQKDVTATDEGGAPGHRLHAHSRGTGSLFLRTGN